MNEVEGGIIVVTIRGSRLRIRRCVMYSTGTEFSKALSEAMNQTPINTAADMAENAKELIESWTPFRVKRLTLTGRKDLTLTFERVMKCG